MAERKYAKGGEIRYIGEHGFYFVVLRASD